MLDFIQKDISLSQMEKTFWLLTKYKVRVVIYLMYGFPTETIEDREATQAMLDRLDNPAYLFSRVYTPIPGKVHCMTTASGTASFRHPRSSRTGRSSLSPTAIRSTFPKFPEAMIK